MEAMKKLFSKNLFTILSVLVLVISSSLSAQQQQVTGLSGWSIFLDPGHSQKENMGIYNYSEAEKNLRVALNLRQMLLDWTDIDTVYLCRDDDQDYVSLSDRTTLANSLGAAHYHSIHSDAGGSTANSTLIMWGQLGIGGPEKTPYGGKKMSQIMVGLLTAGMRTTTRGAMGDRDFYQVAGSTPYLSVNRLSNMASELSEAGFHTNPTQNQLNMNAEWKRLEAKTMFWTILKYKDVARPFAGTVAGILKDIELGTAINGATVSLNGETYITDTWASLFYKYSTDTTLLRNGFYYFENIPAGTHQLDISAPGYDPITTSITTADTFFTFKDVSLVSNVPPKVLFTDPIANDSIYPGKKNISINFSRPINKTNASSNIIITPSVSASLLWTNGDKTVTITTSNFEFETDYQITIKGTLEDNYSHAFDGNGDGISGDDYTLNIRTESADITPPIVTEVYPSPNSTNIEIKPLISITFDEPLNSSTVSSRISLMRNSDQTNVVYLSRLYTINNRSVFNVFFKPEDEPLSENETYTIKLVAGIKDNLGNETVSDTSFEFTTGNSNYLPQTIIDDFDSGIGTWWQPSQSGSTTGIIGDLTKVTAVSNILNLSTNSTQSMMLDYGYLTSNGNWLIREYRNTTTPTFLDNVLLQTYIFGDGNNNLFRFAVRETNTNSIEVSPWYTINWIGWKLVSWDLTKGQTGSWIGNGIIEPPLRIDSYQFTYVLGNSNVGKYYLDDLRTATFSPTDVKNEDNQIPSSFVLEQNYPNPFNPGTQIKFSVPQSSNVKLIVTDILGKEVAVLVNDNLNAGNYNVSFDAAALSSGVYFYTLITDNFKQSRKMILMK
jgi:N-acetylmuramoyl-L-alanine amidase